MRNAYRSYEDFERDELHHSASIDEVFADLAVEELDFEPRERGRARDRDDDE